MNGKWGTIESFYFLQILLYLLGCHNVYLIIQQFVPEKPRSAEEKRIIWRPLWECGQTDLPQRGPHRSVWPHCCSLAWNEMNCSQWMIGQFLIFWKWFKGDWRFMVIYPVPTVIYGSFGPNDSTHRFITTTMSIISNCYGTFGRQRYDR